jgi:hypothetical protein
VWLSCEIPERRKRRQMDEGVEKGRRRDIENMLFGALI